MSHSIRRGAVVRLPAMMAGIAIGMFSVAQPAVAERAPRPSEQDRSAERPRVHKPGKAKVKWRHQAKAHKTKRSHKASTHWSVAKKPTTIAKRRGAHAQAAGAPTHRPTAKSPTARRPDTRSQDASTAAKAPNRHSASTELAAAAERPGMRPEEASASTDTPTRKAVRKLRPVPVKTVARASKSSHHATVRATQRQVRRWPDPDGGFLGVNLDLGLDLGARPGLKICTDIKLGPIKLGLHLVLGHGECFPKPPTIIILPIPVEAPKPTEVKPPVVKPPVVKPPVIKPPVVQPPVVKPPVTKPPVVKPPVTTPPVIEPPVIEPPVIKPPVIKPPVIKPPVIKPPVIKPPVIEPPVIEPPAITPVVATKPDRPVTPETPETPPSADVPDAEPTLPPAIAQPPLTPPAPPAAPALPAAPAAPAAPSANAGDASNAAPPAAQARQAQAPGQNAQTAGRNYIGRPVKAAVDLLPNHRNPLSSVLVVTVVSVVISAIAGALFAAMR